METKSETRRISTQEAARFLGVAKTTLDKLRLVGGGPPFIRVTPRRVVYDLHDLETYLAERRNAPAECRPNQSAVNGCEPGSRGGKVRS